MYETHKYPSREEPFLMIKVTHSALVISVAVGLALTVTRWIPTQPNNTEGTETDALRKAEATKKVEEQLAAKQEAKEEYREAQLREAKRFKSDNDSYYFLSPTPIFYCEQMHNPPLENLAESLKFIGRQNCYETPEKAVFKQFQEDYARGVLSHNTLTKITTFFKNEQQDGIAHLTSHMAKLVDDPSTPPFSRLRGTAKPTLSNHRNLRNKIQVESFKSNLAETEYERARKLLTTLKPPERDRLAKSITESALARAQKFIAANDYEQAAEMLSLAEIRYALSGQTGAFERVGILDARCKMIESADLENAKNSATTASNYTRGAGLQTAELEAKLNEVINKRYKSELNQFDALLAAQKTQSLKQTTAQELTTNSAKKRTQLDALLNRVRALASYRAAMLFAQGQEEGASTIASELCLLEKESGLALQERIYELTKLVPIPEQHMLTYWSLVFDLPAQTTQDSCTSGSVAEVAE